jgi:hypothetical protein
MNAKNVGFFLNATINYIVLIVIVAQVATGEISLVRRRKNKLCSVNI